MLWILIFFPVQKISLYIYGTWHIILPIVLEQNFCFLASEEVGSFFSSFIPLPLPQRTAILPLALCNFFLAALRYLQSLCHYVTNGHILSHSAAEMYATM